MRSTVGHRHSTSWCLTLRQALSVYLSFATTVPI